jgi:competence protein ComEA
MQNDETRASVARRRLEALAASYDSQIPRHHDDRPRARSHAADASWRLSPAHLRVAVGVAVAAGIVMTWWLMSGRPRTSEPHAVQLTAQSQHQDAAASKSSQVIVDVTGKVRRPGIVTLKSGSRVHEAIAKAGGPADGADTTGINLARILADGEQIVVGAPGSAVPMGATGASGSGAGAARVSLNSATIEQLDTLPGIGPVTAKAIVDFRTERGGFRTVEDLLDVTGIGDQTLADIRDQVTP